MQTRAAILWEVGADWSVEDIELDRPKAGEVLVKLAASGLCHSDEHLVTGDMVLDPEIAEMLGLAAARSSAATRAPARCVEVGPGVTTLNEGDHVVLSFIPGVRALPVVRPGPAAPVRPTAPCFSPGARSATSRPGTTARTARTSAPCAASAPSRRTRSSTRRRCIKIDDWIPLDKAALGGLWRDHRVGLGDLRGRRPARRRRSWSSASAASA